MKKDRATRLTEDIAAFMHGYYDRLIRRSCPEAFRGKKPRLSGQDLRIGKPGEQEVRRMILGTLAHATPDDLRYAKREYRKIMAYIRSEVKRIQNELAAAERLRALGPKPEGMDLFEWRKKVWAAQRGSV